jgi:hypothetical protein
LGLLCRLWGTLLSLWLLFLSRLLHRRLQLSDHPALLIKDIGRSRVAPLPRFGVLLVCLLRRCQQQAFQTVQALLQQVAFPLELPFPGP